MPSPYTKLSQKEFKLAYANRRTLSKTLKKEAEIKKLFDLIFKKQNWGGIRGERRRTGGIFPDDWFRKHISKAIQGDFEALKDLSRITGRKINDLKDAFEKREDALLETRLIQQEQEISRHVTWQNVPSNMGGRTRAIMFDPNDSNNKSNLPNDEISQTSDLDDEIPF